MDLNHLLVWMVGAGCAVTLLQLPGRKQALRQAVLPASILLVLGGCLFLLADLAGYIAGTLFVLLMLLPAWGNVFLHFLLMRKRYRAAQLVAGVLSVLSPGRATLGVSIWINAMSLIQRGDWERCSRLLDRMIARGGPESRTARVLKARTEGSWQSFLDWANEPENRREVLSDPHLLDSFLQALGETGQREELVREFDALQSVFRQFPAQTRELCTVKVAAFCGDDLLVAQLLSGSLCDLPVELKRFWMATALQVGGGTEEARRDLEWLARLPDAGIARSAQRRLNSPPVSLEQQPLTDGVRRILHRLSVQSDPRGQPGVLSFAERRRTWGTFSIATILVGVFVCEIPGGSEDIENLIELGAMIVPPIPGEPTAWRTVAAAFLHFGPIHLAMNLMGLVILGRCLEPRWGTALLVFSYLLAAIGSIGLVPYVMNWQTMVEPTILVGASGGVMGLLGGLLVQSLIDLLRYRSRPIRQEFITLMLIVILQTAYDSSTPEVSSEAHLLGMAIGGASALLWNAVWNVQARFRSRL